VPAWPTFGFYRSSLFGPTGSITIMPHILVVRTMYMCSSNTKHLIRFVDIKQLKKKRNNYVYLYDHSNELILSFRPQQMTPFLKCLTQYVKQYNPHLSVSINKHRKTDISDTNRMSMLP